MSTAQDNDDAAIPRDFYVLWLGQLLSIIGSGMTSFALGILTYQRHRSVADFSLVVLCYSLPGVLAAGFFGALLDRWDRKRLLMISALGAGLSTLAIALVAILGSIQTWQIYLCVAGISLFGAAQAPGLGILTAVLVPKAHYARANGLWQLTMGLSLIISPLLAGYLVGRVGIQAIVVVDACSYLFAIAGLALISVPARAVPDYAEKEPVLSWQAITGGWRYVAGRGGLVQLLAFALLVHFALNAMQLLVVPIVLNLGDARSLSFVMALCSAGFIMGGVGMSAWGGPKRRVRGILGAALVMGLGLFVAGVSPHVGAVAAGMFLLTAAIPVALSCDASIWQAKTDADVQGRVFAFTAMATQAVQPIACLVVPMLCTAVGPALQPGGALAPSIAAFTGAGPGRPEGALLALLGLLLALATVVGNLSTRLRNVESDLPDRAQEAPLLELGAAPANAEG